MKFLAWFKSNSGLIVESLTVIAFLVWAQNESSWESYAATFVAGVVLAASSITRIHDHFSGEDFRKRQEVERKDLGLLVNRIDIEMKNFRHIAEKKSYSGEPHRETVEDSSVELLEVEVKKFEDCPRLRLLASDVLDEIKIVRKQPKSGKSVRELIQRVQLLRDAANQRLRNLGVAT